MDRKIIEEIFKLGSDALYNTLNPDNGNVDDRYLELKEEAVKLFSIQLVSKRISDEEIEEIAKKEIPYSNGCYGEGEYSEGKREGFEEGLEYYRDKIL